MKHVHRALHDFAETIVFFKSQFNDYLLTPLGALDLILQSPSCLSGHGSVAFNILSVRNNSLLNVSVLYPLNSVDNKRL